MVVLGILGCEDRNVRLAIEKPFLVFVLVRSSGNRVLLLCNNGLLSQLSPIDCSSSYLNE